MIVGMLRARLILRQARSLKDKRQVVSGVKDKLREKFGVAAAEVDLMDDRQQAVLGFASVANESAHARQVLEQIVQALRVHPVAELAEWHLETQGMTS